jgi:hypothetical protein
MKTTLLAVAIALAAATPAAAVSPPAPEGQALYPETVAAHGVAGAQKTIVRLVRGSGVLASGARFTLGASNVDYEAPGLTFKALRISFVRFGVNAVKLRGTGVVNGARVPFAAVGVHNALPGVDVFRIDWNHGAARGGRVAEGSVFIR